MQKPARYLNKVAHWPQWLAGILAIFTTVGLSFPALGAGLGDWINYYATGGPLIRGLFHILFGLISLIAGALSNLCVLLINTVVLPGQNSLFFGAQNQVTVVKQAFDSMLSIANVLFLVALMVFAVMIITRQAGYNFKKAITALVVAVVLANLSYQLVQVLIEIGDALRNSGTLLFGNSMSAGALGEWLQSMAVLAPAIIDPSVSTAKFIVTEFASMAMQIILLYVFFRLMFILIERAIRLVILTIFAPIQAALSVLPAKDLQFGSNWFSEVIRWILVLPLVFILIGIARKIMPDDVASTLQQFLQNVWPSEAGAGTSVPTITGFTFQFIVGLGILVTAANVPALLKLPISAATKFFTDTVTGAAGKWARGELGARAKDLGFKAAQRTAAGRWLYGQTVGRMGARQSEIEAQAKKRVFTAREAGTAITRERYLTMKDQFEAIKTNRLDAAAGAQGRGYATFEDWEKDPAADKDKRAAAKREIEDALNHTSMGIGLGSAEYDYMVVLGKGAQEDYELGRTPEETKKLYEDAKEKFIQSGDKDKQAAYEMQKYFDVLKKQALRLTGEPGKQAAALRNEIAENDADLLLKRAGLPPKFGVSKVFKEGEVGPAAGADYVALAVAKERYDTANASLIAASNNIVGQPGGRDLDLVLKSSPDETLRLVGGTGTTSNDTRASLNNITNVGSVNLALNIHNKPIQEEIKRIQARGDLTEQDKKNLIDTQLEKAGTLNAVPNDRYAIAEALARGVGLSELGRAHQIADGWKNPTLQPLVQTAITNLIETRGSQAGLAAAEKKVADTISEKDSYINAVNTFLSQPSPVPGATSLDYLKKEASDIDAGITKFLATVKDADLPIGTAMGAARLQGVTPTVTTQQLSDIVNHLGLTALKPGKDITTPDGFGKNMSVKDTLDMIRNIKAITNRKV